MKDILKFILVFLISYGLLIYFCNLNRVQLIIPTTFKNAVELFVKSALQAAYIETQNEVEDRKSVV